MTNKIIFPSIKVGVPDSPNTAFWVDIIDIDSEDLLVKVEETLEGDDSSIIDISFSDLYIYDYVVGSEYYEFKDELNSLLIELYNADLDEDIYDEYRDIIIDFAELDYDSQRKAMGALEIEKAPCDLENLQKVIECIDEIEILENDPMEFKYSDKFDIYIRCDYN